MFIAEANPNMQSLGRRVDTARVWTRICIESVSRRVREEVPRRNVERAGERHDSGDTDLALRPLDETDGHAVQARLLRKPFLRQAGSTTERPHAAPEVLKALFPLLRLILHDECDARSGSAANRQRIRFTPGRVLPRSCAHRTAADACLAASVRAAPGEAAA